MIQVLNNLNAINIEEEIDENGVTTVAVTRYLKPEYEKFENYIEIIKILKKLFDASNITTFSVKLYSAFIDEKGYESSFKELEKDYTQSDKKYLLSILGKKYLINQDYDSNGNILQQIFLEETFSFLGFEMTKEEKSHDTVIYQLKNRKPYNKNDLIPIEEKSLQEILYEYYLKSEMTDFTLICSDNREIKIHKIILLRIPDSYFVKVLNNSMRETSESKIIFEEDCEIVKAVIDYLYLGRDKFEGKYLKTELNLTRLYLFAKRLNLEGLSQAILDIINSSVTNFDEMIIQTFNELREEFPQDDYLNKIGMSFNEETILDVVKKQFKEEETFTIYDPIIGYNIEVTGILYKTSYDSFNGLSAAWKYIYNGKKEYKVTLYYMNISSNSKLKFNIKSNFNHVRYKQLIDYYFNNRNVYKQNPNFYLTLPKEYFNNLNFDLTIEFLGKFGLLIVDEETLTSDLLILHSEKKPEVKFYTSKTSSLNPYMAFNIPSKDEELTSFLIKECKMNQKNEIQEQEKLSLVKKRVETVQKLTRYETRISSTTTFKDITIFGLDFYYLKSKITINLVVPKNNDDPFFFCETPKELCFISVVMLSSKYYKYRNYSKYGLKPHFTLQDHKFWINFFKYVTVDLSIFIRTFEWKIVSREKNLIVLDDTLYLHRVDDRILYYRTDNNTYVPDYEEMSKVKWVLLTR